LIYARFERSSDTLFRVRGFDSKSSSVKKRGDEFVLEMLEWKDITYKIRGHTILDSVSGKAHPGRLLAVIGPSGAGKTTLLRALIGRIIQQRYTELIGQILLNGQVLDSERTNYRIGFVPQEDQFFFFPN